MSHKTLSVKKSIVVAILACALNTVALADQPTLSIQQQARLDFAGIVVTVVVNCGDGPSSTNQTDVFVRQGDLTSGGGEVFSSDGTRQVLEIFIPGPFEPGEAIASADLVCGLIPLAEGLVLGRTITIRE